MLTPMPIVKFTAAAFASGMVLFLFLFLFYPAAAFFDIPGISAWSIGLLAAYGIVLWRCFSYGTPELAGAVILGGCLLLGVAFAVSTPLPADAGVHPRMPSDGMTAFSDPATGMWGFVDIDGRTVITPKFDAVLDFKDGMTWAAFPKLKMWCQVDKRGVISTSPCKPDLITCEQCSYRILFPLRGRYRASLRLGVGLSIRDIVGGVADGVLDNLDRLKARWSAENACGRAAACEL